MNKSKKTAVLAARVTPQFKAALAVAAAHQHRSQASMLEHLVFEYCRQHRLSKSIKKAIAPGGEDL